MSASVNDKITDTRNAARPNSAKVSSPRTAGGNSLSCDSLSGWPTASKVHFVTYQVDSNSNPVSSTQLDCYGIVSGNNIGSLAVIDGTDAGNSIGDIVEMLPTAAWGQDLSDALTSQHTRTGAHTAITATSINNSGVLTQTGLATFTAGTSLPTGDIGTNDIANASVTPDKFSVGIQTSSVVTSETTTSTSYAGLTTPHTVAVTVGANGILLIGFSAANVSNNTADAICTMSIALSGANTLASADNISGVHQDHTANVSDTVNRVVMLSGLTAGSTTVTVQVKVSTGGGGAGTGTWANRHLWALPL